MEVASGYLRANATVRIPIQLGTVIPYASYQTWEYRKHTNNRPKPMPDGVLEPEDPANVERSLRGIVIWSTISFVLLVGVIVIFFW